MTEHGLCQCGCGERTVVSQVTDRYHGWVKGEPRRFLAGHNNVLRRVTYRVEDRGYKTPCWVWQGSLNHAGYARKGSQQCHRLMWEQFNGPIPAGLEPDHLCRVRACVNPEHLELVTHAENCRRGAAARSANTPPGIPTEIREARRANQWSQSDLAVRLGVTQSLIGQWETGRTRPPKHRIEQLSELLRRDLAEFSGRGPQPAWTNGGST